MWAPGSDCNLCGNRDYFRCKDIYKSDKIVTFCIYFLRKIVFLVKNVGNLGGNR